MSRTWIEINQQALVNNVSSVRKLLNDTTAFMAVVKANAYGHGIEQVIPVLDERVDWFGVDSLQEALAVRAFSQTKILILNPMDPDDAEEIASNGFHQMISTIEQVHTFESAAQKMGQNGLIHLKIDTGMSRQGASQEEYSAVMDAISESNHLTLVGIATHFANADMPNDEKTVEQTRSFLASCESEKQRLGDDHILLHAANSSATLLNPETHLDIVRVGILLYGLWPSSDVAEQASDVELEPVLSLKSRISQVKNISEGSAVGYGSTERVTRPSKIALLPLGYAEGYDRRLSALAHVLIRGMRAKIIGNISMNLLTVDVTDIAEVAAGDIATLIGSDGEDEISVQELTQQADIITYELVARLKEALPRISL